MTTILEALFYLCLAALVYVYAGYPLLLALVARLWPRPVSRGSVTPSMSLLIAAYNEEDDLGERLDNAQALDYPADRLEVVVASDGSSDRTVEVARSRGVRVLDLPRQGKIPALDAAVAASGGEVLVFSDANTLFAPDALRRLAENFADPQVGGVAGNTGYRLQEDTESSGRGENLYWDYDTRLKDLESRSGSVVSAHGGIYALRRELYELAPDPAVTDDFFISTGVIRGGRRLVFEPRARAWEFAVPESGREFRRRIRLMTRGLRSLYLRRPLLNPLRYGFYAVALFSRKLLRRVLPLALLGLLATSLLLWEQPFFRWVAVGQLAFYAQALVGWMTRRTTVGQARALYVPFFYCMANLAALVALVRFLRGERIVRWQPQRHPVR